jgi:hypothetical protein
MERPSCRPERGLLFAPQTRRTTAVEGPLQLNFTTDGSGSLLHENRGASWELPETFISLHAGKGSFDFAQDDK